VFYPVQKLNGPLEDAVSNAISQSVGKAFFGGDPKSKEAVSRSDFYAMTLSKTGQQFFGTPQGKGLLTKVSWAVALPAFAVGLLVGYMVFHKKA